MEGFMKHKIIWNLVILEKCFQKLSVQKKLLFQRMLDDVLKDECKTLNYYMMLMDLRRSAFTQIIDILLETKQNIIVYLLLKITIDS